MSLLCWDPRADAALQVGLSRAEQWGRIPSLALLPTLLWMQPRTHLAFWALSAHGWIMSSLSSPSPFGQNLFIPQPVLVLGIAPTQMQHLAPGLAKHHEIFMGILFKLVQVSVDGIPSFSVSTTSFSLVSSANLLRLHLRPLSISFVKILNNTGPSMQPQGTPPVMDVHHDFETLTPTL
ncbi:hypothetical protein HGM15179_014964 [Zosterops borbonicus]|uniref:Uncharacterized protein n=1 Tax=Zosterops borbonicus TaxID=364589 RepID=A0A8K1G5B1_9PASS|nr:hypothetical protein HGM15179_014964 [Zosterops borbonicus]